MRYLKQAVILILGLIVIAFILAIDAGGLRTRLSKERQQLEFRAKVVTLNYDIPPFNDLLVFAKDPQNANNQNLSQYVRYYRKVTGLFPSMGDAYHFLGYCYYYLGQYQEAILSYQKAIELSPNLFWSYYNLGLILFKAGQFENAAPFFLKAVSFRPKEIVNEMVTSAAFRQIMSEQNFDFKMDSSLEKSYDNTYYLLAASLQASGQERQAQEVFNNIKGLYNKENTPSLKELANLNLGIF